VAFSKSPNLNNLPKVIKLISDYLEAESSRKRASLSESVKLRKIASRLNQKFLKSIKNYKFSRISIFSLKKHSNQQQGNFLGAIWIQHFINEIIKHLGSESVQLHSNNYKKIKELLEQLNFHYREINEINPKVKEINEKIQGISNFYEKITGSSKIEDDSSFDHYMERDISKVKKFVSNMYEVIEELSRALDLAKKENAINEVVLGQIVDRCKNNKGSLLKIYCVTRTISQVIKNVKVSQEEGGA